LQQKKILIGFDVMSGDIGCEEAVKAALEMVQTSPNLTIYLVGDTKKIAKILGDND